MHNTKIQQNNKYISDSDIKWYYDLDKYNAFYKINSLRMDHKISSRLSKHPRREKSDQFT